MTPTRALLSLTAVLSLLAANAGCSSPCGGACDPAQEICDSSRDCAFLQNGNPNPLGGLVASETCQAVDPACAGEPSCACVCPGDECARRLVECTEVEQGDGPPLVVLSSGCSE